MSYHRKIRKNGTRFHQRLVQWSHRKGASTVLWASPTFDVYKIIIKEYTNKVNEITERPWDIRKSSCPGCPRKQRSHEIVSDIRVPAYSYINMLIIIRSRSASWIWSSILLNKYLLSIYSISDLLLVLARLPGVSAGIRGESDCGSSCIMNTVVSFFLL